MWSSTDNITIKKEDSVFSVVINNNNDDDNGCGINWQRNDVLFTEGTGFYCCGWLT